MCLLAVDGQIQKEPEGRRGLSDGDPLTTCSQSLEIRSKHVSIACCSNQKAFAMPDLTEVPFTKSASMIPDVCNHKVWSNINFLGLSNGCQPG